MNTTPESKSRPGVVHCSVDLTWNLFSDLWIDSFQYIVLDWLSQCNAYQYNSPALNNVNFCLFLGHMRLWRCLISLIFCTPYMCKWGTQYNTPFNMMLIWWSLRWISYRKLVSRCTGMNGNQQLPQSCGICSAVQFMCSWDDTCQIEKQNTSCVLGSVILIDR